MAWLTDWSKRVKLTVDSSKVDSDLTDFPVALTIVSGTNTESVIMDAVVSGGITDTFTGPNGTPPDSALWTKEGTGSASVTNNKMRLSIADGYSEGSNLNTDGIYHACGDFDVQIEWNNIGGNPSTDTLYTYLAARTHETDRRVYLYYAWYPGGWGFLTQTYDGSGHGEDLTYVAHNPTKLRIKRVGSTWSTYKWDGSNWDTLISASAYVFSTAPVYFLFGMSNSASYPAATVDFDNFQVTSDWAYYDYSKKIAVTADDGTTQCPVEIQQWDMMERKAILWTKVPTVSSGIDTDLYLYYDETKDDNDTYVGTVNSAPAQNVWDSNFKAVYHMAQDPSGGSDAIKNSAAAVNHGTSAGTMTFSDLVDGKIGKAIDFDGTDDYLNCGSDSSLDDISTITVEATFKAGGWGEGNAGRVAVKAVDNGYGWNIYVQGVGMNRVGLQRGWSTTDGVWYTPTDSITLDDWYYVAYQYDRSYSPSDKPILYLNTVSQTVTTITTPVGSIESDAAQNMLIGSRSAPDREFDGIIDEVRISDIYRSEAWIKASYHSSWNTLFTYGAEELRPIFLFYGTVLVGGSPAARSVCLYRRSTGELMGITTSSGIDGYFEVGSWYNEYHYVVILPELDEDYNLLSYDKIHPEI